MPLTPEQRARQDIDIQTAAGWVAQDYKSINIYARPNTSGLPTAAAREYPAQSKAQPLLSHQLHIMQKVELPLRRQLESPHRI